MTQHHIELPESPTRPQEWDASSSSEAPASSDPLPPGNKLHTPHKRRTEGIKHGTQNQNGGGVESKVGLNREADIDNRENTSKGRDRKPHRSRRRTRHRRPRQPPQHQRGRRKRRSRPGRPWRRRTRRSWG
jgi:hypothetical protein